MRPSPLLLVLAVVLGAAPAVTTGQAQAMDSAAAPALEKRLPNQALRLRRARGISFLAWLVLTSGSFFSHV